MPTATLDPAGPTAPKIDVNLSLYPVPAGARTPGVAMFDWLAAVAMQGYLTKGMKVTADRALSDDEKDDEIAERSYRMAAAMMRARTEAHNRLQ